MLVELPVCVPLPCGFARFIQACWGGVVGLRPFAQLYCLDHSRVIIRKGLDWTEPGPLGALLAREWVPLPLLFRSSCCRLLSAHSVNEICHHLEYLREREGDVVVGEEFFCTVGLRGRGCAFSLGVSRATSPKHGSLRLMVCGNMCSCVQVLTPSKGEVR